MIRRKLFSECVHTLERCGNDSAMFDAKCIFEDILGEHDIFLRFDEPVPDDAADRIRELISRRAEGNPLQYLLGQWEFYGFPFKVGEGVLIPRPDTETLVDQIIEICRRRKLRSPVIADLCSGSGCIAVALKKMLPDSTVFAVELSKKAAQFLRENASLNDAQINIVMGDVLSPETAEKFSGLDIIVCNPPYLTDEDMTKLQKEVAFEPETALHGGSDGLDFYRVITAVWKNTLAAEGILAYEFGIGQHDDVEKILALNGFENITFARDAGGIIRTAAATRSEENNG